ncbi:MAG: ABC transporter permease [Nitrososphaerota archaeon]|nr:ABC transporter permease [Nitrososphaerota archaeon]
MGESSGAGFVFRFLRKDKAALVGMAIGAVFFAFAAIEGILQIVGGYIRQQSLGWILLPSNPLQVDFHYSLFPPSLSSVAAILGFDYEGRSILSEILYAAPRDAAAAVIVVSSAILIGMLTGIAAGYTGGWADEILMRVTDAFLAFPAIFLAIALAILLGNGYTVVLIALVVVWWPPYARFFRAQTLRERNRGYVEASKLSGISSVRIMSRHIFPNTIDPIIAIASLDLGNVILTYSTLAFLGIGLQLNVPEWGSMTSDGLAYVPGAWWWTLFPALAIMLVVVCFSIIGDRIQDLVGGRLSY